MHPVDIRKTMVKNHATATPVEQQEVYPGYLYKVAAGHNACQEMLAPSEAEAGSCFGCSVSLFSDTGSITANHKQTLRAERVSCSPQH